MPHRSWSCMWSLPASGPLKWKLSQIWHPSHSSGTRSSPTTCSELTWFSFLVTRSEGQDSNRCSQCGCGFCREARIGSCWSLGISVEVAVWHHQRLIWYPLPGASGSSDNIAQSEEPCFYELKHFVECAKSLGDIKFCQDFDKVLKTCKEIDLIKMFKLKKWETGFGDQVTLAKKKKCNCKLGRWLSW